MKIIGLGVPAFRDLSQRCIITEITRHFPYCSRAKRLLCKTVSHGACERKSTLAVLSQLTFPQVEKRLTHSASSSGYCKARTESHEKALAHERTRSARRIHEQLVLPASNMCVTLVRMSMHQARMIWQIQTHRKEDFLKITGSCVKLREFAASRTCSQWQCDVLRTTSMLFPFCIDHVDPYHNSTQHRTKH